MTKLNGTSAHLFAGLAESLKTRGASRFDKTAGAKTADKAFRDLLHTVSNAAPKTPDDQSAEGPKKTDALRPRLARFAERDELKDETVDERTDQPRSRGHRASPSRSIPRRRRKFQSRVSLPNIAGQELLAAQIVEPQMQAQTQGQAQAEPRPQLPAGDGKSAPVRSVAGQESPAASLAKTLAADTAKPAARTDAAATQPATVPQTTASMPGPVPATPGFETATASIEQAAKVMTTRGSARGDKGHRAPAGNPSSAGRAVHRAPTGCACCRGGARRHRSGLDRCPNRTVTGQLHPISRSSC